MEVQILLLLEFLSVQVYCWYICNLWSNPPETKTDTEGNVFTSNTYDFRSYFFLIKMFKSGDSMESCRQIKAQLTVFFVDAKSTKQWSNSTFKDFIFWNFYQRLFLFSIYSTEGMCVMSEHSKMSEKMFFIWF